ncbi:MAG TPA: MMPL family transporter, partial [Nevskiaceae bacterium]|nr:MMPL family transporter [Nevskiaceae bacterium]
MKPENSAAADPVQRDRDSVIARLVARMQRHALAVVGVALALGALLAWYTAGHLSVDTNNQNMLSPGLAWRKAETELDRLFPGNAGSLVLVIDGTTPEVADDAQRRLADAMKSEPALFSQVSAAEIEPYFRRNGLLYLSTGELQKLSDDLTQAQPFLGALNEDPSLHGLFTLLDRAVTHADAADFDMSKALGDIAEGIDAARQEKFWRLSWQGLLGGPPRPDATRRFITVDAVKDYSQLLPAEKPIDRVRALAQSLSLDAAHGVSVRLTGSTAMEHQELQTAFGGIGLVLGVAMLMVMVLLYLALRSVRLVVCAVLTLIYGLLATASFAAATIGHLNLISVAFSVLYVGLGLDYALYLTMQYRELIGHGLAHRVALPRAAREVGGFMLVCAATTSLGFFA